MKNIKFSVNLKKCSRDLGVTPRASLIGPPEGKILKIVTVSQNRLNIIEKYKILCKSEKKF